MEKASFLSPPLNSKCKPVETERIPSDPPETFGASKIRPPEIEIALDVAATLPELLVDESAAGLSLSAAANHRETPAAAPGIGKGSLWWKDDDKLQESANGTNLQVLIHRHRTQLKSMIDQAMNELEELMPQKHAQDSGPYHVREPLESNGLDEAVVRFMDEEFESKIMLALPEPVGDANPVGPDPSQPPGPRQELMTPTNTANFSTPQISPHLPMISEDRITSYVGSTVKSKSLGDMSCDTTAFKPFGERASIDTARDSVTTSQSMVRWESTNNGNDKMHSDTADQWSRETTIDREPSWNASQASRGCTPDASIAPSPPWSKFGQHRGGGRRPQPDVKGARFFDSEFSGHSGHELMGHGSIDAKNARIEEIRAFRDQVQAELWNSKDWLQRWVTHPAFDISSCFLIILNTAMNGLEVEMLVNHNGTRGIPFMTIQHVFTIVFTVELLLRIGAYRMEFCSTKDWAWNLFDTLVVLVGLGEMVMIFVAGDEDIINSTSQRMLRTVRVVRNLRIVRMLRFFYELRQMLLAVFGSMKTLMWLGILMTLMLYFFSICLTSAVYDFLDGEGRDDPDEELLRHEFGSLFKSAMSLFKAITNGVSWGQVMEPLSKIGWVIEAMYLGYIVFAVFAFMNAVTSVFVDNSMRATQSQQEQRIHRELEVKEETEKHLEYIFNDIDIDGSNRITEAELEAYLEDQRASAYFSTLGLGRPDAKTLFKLFDTDESGELDIDEFISGCLRMKGEAKSFEIAELRKETNKVLRRLTRFMDYTHTMLDGIKVLCVDVSTHVGVKSPSLRSPSRPQFKR